MQATVGWDPGEFIDVANKVTCLYADNHCSHWIRYTQLRKVEGLGLGHVEE